MSNPIRLLHFADVHVGMENYGRLDLDSGTSTRVRDFLDRMDEVIDYGINNKADIYCYFTCTMFRLQYVYPAAAYCYIKA